MTAAEGARSPEDVVVGERNRAAARMAVLTAISRATGFARVIVVAAVLGTSYLGNVYQSANTVPNILFELFAAGVLQSVLVPIMVEAVDRSRHDEAEHTAGVVLGAILTLLSAMVAAGLVMGPWIMRLLVSGVDDAAVQEAQVALGTFLLWFFLPQILFYAANLVATAVLNATGYFALPVFAPTVNNVVVIASYLLFAAMRHGQPPSLVLTLPEKLVLAVGTTLGVVAFCAVPVIGLWRTGFTLRPRFELRHPTLRRLARQGLWAAGFLALTQLLLVDVLYLANAVEGGVVVYQLAYVLFMLPHSLFAVPVFTTAFPALTRSANAAEWSAFGREVSRATRSIVFFTVISAGALVALAGPLSEVVALGNASGHTREVAGAIAAFAVGLPGFSLLLFLTRVCYAYGDIRHPTLVNVAVLVVGVGCMTVLTGMVGDEARVTVIGLGYALAQLVGAGLLGAVVLRRVHHEGAGVQRIGMPAVRVLVSTVVAAAAVGFVGARIDDGSRSVAVAELVVGGSVLVIVALGLYWVLGGPAPVPAVRSLGGDPGRGDRR